MRISNRASSQTVIYFSLCSSLVEYVFVFFYSATCPACRRFNPTWEQISCGFTDKSLVFAHLEGNANQGVINAYQITHTPTLALFHRVVVFSSWIVAGSLDSDSVLWPASEGSIAFLCESFFFSFVSSLGTNWLSKSWFSCSSHYGRGGSVPRLCFYGPSL